MKFKVPVFGASNKFAWLDEKATEGAKVGVNLIGPDGKRVSANTWKKLLAGGNQSGGSSNIGTTDDVNEGRFNLYFTKKRAQDAVGEILANSANVTLTYGGDPKAIKADLTDVTVTAGGALKKYGFDAKGRLSESDDATTDDLSEGSANLYFTGDRARAAAVDNAITPGVTNKAPSEDAVAKALANVPTGVPYYVPAGDTFTVPLDQQALFSDPITLDGDLVVDGRLIDARGRVAGTSHTDTSTIAIAGDGTPTSPLSATAKISVVAGNKIIAKSDGLFTDSGGIHIDDRVATYANLPSPPPTGYTTYLVEADGLIYIWDGSVWPAEGEGVAIGGGGFSKYASVTIGSDYSSSSEYQMLQFNTVTIDNDSIFDTGTYEFVAPRDGMYIVQTSVHYTGQGVMAVYVNGVISPWGQAALNRYWNYMMCMIHVSKNDRIGMAVYSGGTVYATDSQMHLFY